MFADGVDVGFLAGLAAIGFEAEEVPFDGLCAAIGRCCDDGGVSRLIILSEPRGSSESALRFGGAAAGATAGETDFGASPVIWARRSPI